MWSSWCYRTHFPNEETNAQEGKSAHLRLYRYKENQILSSSHLDTGLPRWLSGKESTGNTRDARDPGSIPGSGRSSGEGNGNPFQDSCLENSTDRGAWGATVHGVAKSWTQLSDWTLSLWLSQFLYLFFPFLFIEKLDSFFPEPTFFLKVFIKHSNRLLTFWPFRNTGSLGTWVATGTSFTKCVTTSRMGLNLSYLQRFYHWLPSMPPSTFLFWRQHPSSASFLCQPRVSPRDKQILRSLKADTLQAGSRLVGEDTQSFTHPGWQRLCLTQGPQIFPTGSVEQAWQIVIFFFF